MPRQTKAPVFAIRKSDNENLFLIMKNGIFNWVPLSEARTYPSKYAAKDHANILDEIYRLPDACRIVKVIW